MENAIVASGSREISPELSPEEILGKQAKIIKALRYLIEKKTTVFKDEKTGKISKHVEAMAWQSIASMFGLMPKITRCEEDENGMIAECQLVKWSTGEVVGENSAYVGRDEKQWYGGVAYRKDGSRYELPKKPFNQIRSMAQTRATRQTIKVALGHVVILLENNLGIDISKTTEERREEERVKEPEVPQIPMATPAQFATIKTKMEAAGVDSKTLTDQFGPSGQLTEEKAALVIAHLDGVIASREGAQEG